MARVARGRFVCHHLLITGGGTGGTGTLCLPSMGGTGTLCLPSIIDYWKRLSKK